MGFVAPLVLLGLGALAIPVLLHLIQREKKRVVEFPSLMFLRRIPYQSVRRRRIRHWALLLMRLAALALIVAAFARPFFRRQTLAAATQNGAREVVVLVDASYSMGYGDRWARAQAAARGAINALASGDRGSLVLFSTSAELAVRSTADRGRLLAALDDGGGRPGRYPLRAGTEAWRQHPRRVAAARREIDPDQRLSATRLGRHAGARRREATGSDGADPDRGRRRDDLEPVGHAGLPERTRFENHDRVTVTAGVANHSATAASRVPADARDRRPRHPVAAGRRRRQRSRAASCSRRSRSPRATCARRSACRTTISRATTCSTSSCPRPSR